MSEPGDIWQRYDAKVVQIQQLEARVAELESAVATGQHERDHWTRVARQLNKKLHVARDLAERLRAAQYEHAPVEAASASDPAMASIGPEFDRAREVLGLVLSALTRALDDDDEAVAELGRRLRHHAGGKLLYSITRGALTLVPVDGRYLVDRPWLARLDLAALRGELDVSAQSGIFTRPEGASILHTEPPVHRPDLQARLADLVRMPTGGAAPTPFPLVEGETSGSELQIDLDDEVDAYDSDVGDLPPPPPMPVAQLFTPPPPLLAALPAEDLAPHSHPTEPPRRLEDTVRGVIQSTGPRGEAFIPNLRIGRLIKTPSGG